MKNLSILLVMALCAPSIGVAELVIPIESVENHVNVRFAADAKSEIVGHLNKGDSMPYVKSVPGWHEVALQGGGTGFIHEDWCIVVDDATTVATVEPAAKAAVEEVEVAAPIELAEVEADAEMPVAAQEESGSAEVEAWEEEEETVDASALHSATEQDGAIDEAIVETAEPVQDAVAAGDGEQTDVATTAVAAEAIAGATQGPPGPAGPAGPPGPPGSAGSSTIEGSPDYLMKFTSSTIGGNSQVFDDGRNIGIGTNEPKQRLEVNGNIQIHERNSNVAALMLTQVDGETGYIMHNRASTLTIGAGSVDRITIDNNGYVGIGMSRPQHPIEMASGAFVTDGGVWTNSSSITKKENVVELTPEEAIKVLVDLEPVHFNYIADDGEDYIGFIAEDVPELVATSDRSGLSAMDIVAVLTKVVQEQQARIDALEEKLERNR